MAALFRTMPGVHTLTEIPDAPSACVTGEGKQTSPPTLVPPVLCPQTGGMRRRSRPARLKPAGELVRKRCRRELARAVNRESVEILLRVRSMGPSQVAPSVKARFPLRIAQHTREAIALASGRCAAQALGAWRGTSAWKRFSGSSIS